MPGTAPLARPPALELCGLVKRYRAGLLRPARQVLSEVSLALAAGETLGLLGPNGSGKSTLLRIAAGVERPSQGCVRVFGRSCQDPRARRRTGYLPDGSPFPPELSPRAVLGLLGELYGLERRERRRTAEALLERVGLGRDARRPLAGFSQGMLRRFALAQAFLHGPELLLLDEPTAGLDSEGHLVLEELLAEARARGTALLLATHVAADLAQHCERACVLLDGRIAAQGPAGEFAGSGVLLALYRRLSAAARVR
jgi:ABC-type multidrug transport system ATPase subunit